jgi:polysaccharide pyruvyl transferase WcaK-like protein
MIKRKKIGLFTMPLTTNYGGIIQLVALQDYLISQSYDTILINRRYPESKIKRVLTKLVESRLLFDIKHILLRKKMASLINDFKKQNIKKTTPAFYDDETLKKAVVNLNLDAVIVGSDQVWRMDYMKGLYKNAFLNFITDTKTKKIAYAASFGKDNWTEKNLIEGVKQLLSDFDAVSVREDTGVTICQDEFKLKDVSHVVDPTLLVEPTYYNKYLKDSKSNGAGIFTYVLDNNEFRDIVISKISKSLDLPVHKINVDKDFDKLSKIKNYKLPSMEEWLKGFKEADFVITDSFHGTIFSIIFNKPFITVVNEKRGATRFTSFLKLLKLEQRLIYDGRNNDLNVWEQAIDYNEVNALLSKQREFSRSFLNTALNK